jgi:hypothetical protein
MTPSKVDKIIEKIKEKLLKDIVPDDVTGKIIVNTQSGGVSGQVKLEIVL